MNSHAKAITLTLSLAILLTGASGFGQEQSLRKHDLPKQVLAAFLKSYPHATMKGFSKETEKGATIFEIESVDGTIHRDVAYMADGSLISVEESMTYAQLPESVRTAMKTEHAGAKVLKCEKVIKDTTTQYELLVTHGKEGEHELVFNADGTLAKPEKK